MCARASGALGRCVPRWSGSPSLHPMSCLCLCLWLPAAPVSTTVSVVVDRWRGALTPDEYDGRVLALLSPALRPVQALAVGRGPSYLAALDGTFEITEAALRDHLGRLGLYTEEVRWFVVAQRPVVWALHPCPHTTKGHTPASVCLCRVSLGLHCRCRAVTSWLAVSCAAPTHAAL